MEKIGCVGHDCDECQRGTKARKQKLWAIAYEAGGYIDPYSIRPLRRDAIAAFCSDPAGPTWGYWKARGAVPVKVSVSLRSNSGIKPSA